jgi:DNA topoisomerase IB
MPNSMVFCEVAEKLHVQNTVRSKRTNKRIHHCEESEEAEEQIKQ